MKEFFEAIRTFLANFSFESLVNTIKEIFKSPDTESKVDQIISDIKATIE